MSSPHLNNLIIIGCMLTYLSVIFLGLDSGLSSISAFPYGKFYFYHRKYFHCLNYVEIFVFL